MVWESGGVIAWIVISNCIKIIEGILHRTYAEPFFEMGEYSSGGN
nr:hypothetical protein [Bartonella grahamii]